MTSIIFFNFSKKKKNQLRCLIKCFNCLYVLLLLSFAQPGIVSGQCNINNNSACNVNAGNDEFICPPATDFMLFGIQGQGQSNPCWTNDPSNSPTLAIDDMFTFVPTIHNNGMEVQPGTYIFWMCVDCEGHQEKQCDEVIITIPQITDPVITSSAMFDPNVGCYIICEEATFCGTLPASGEYETWEVLDNNGETYDDVIINGNKIEIANTFWNCELELTYKICFEIADKPDCCKSVTECIQMPDVPDPDEVALRVVGGNPVCGEEFRLELVGVQSQTAPICFSQHLWANTSKPPGSGSVDIATPADPATFVSVCGLGEYEFCYIRTTDDRCGGAQITKCITVLVLPDATLPLPNELEYLICSGCINENAITFCLPECNPVTECIQSNAECEDPDCRAIDLITGFQYNWLPWFIKDPDVEITPLNERCMQVLFPSNPYKGSGIIANFNGTMKPEYNATKVAECFSNNWDLENTCVSITQYKLSFDYPLIVDSLITFCDSSVNPTINVLDYVLNYDSQLDAGPLPSYRYEFIETPTGSGVPLNITRALRNTQQLDVNGIYIVKVYLRQQGIDPLTNLMVDCSKEAEIEIHFLGDICISAGSSFSTCEECAYLTGSLPTDCFNGQINHPTIWRYLGSEPSVVILNASAPLSEVCGLELGKAYMFEYCTVDWNCGDQCDTITITRDTCASCEPELFLFEVAINHTMGTDPSKDHYSITGSFVIPPGYELCGNQCLISFLPGGDPLVWDNGPNCSAPDPNGLVTFSGIATQPIGTGNGVAYMELTLCLEVTGEICTDTLEVEYDVCPPGDCLIVPHVTNGNEQNTVILHLDIYLPFGISQDCQGTVAHVTFEYTCGDGLLIPNMGQNPIPFTVSAGFNSVQTLIDLSMIQSPCFYVVVNVPVCEYMCCELFCWSQILGEGVLGTTIADEFPAIVFPNPAKDKIRFQYLNDGLAYSVKILDLNGKIVLEEKILEDELNIGHLDNGTYFIVVENEYESIITKLLIAK